MSAACRGSLAASTAALTLALALEAAGVLERLDSLHLPAGGRPAWLVVSATASVWVSGLVVVATLALAAAGRRVPPWLWGASASLVLATIAAEALKLAFEVPRPGGGVAAAGGGVLGLLEAYSFPSGHAARASALAYWLGLRPRGRRLQAPAAWAWAFVVAASRVALHAHWVSDVAAGLALGAWVSSVTRVLAVPLGCEAKAQRPHRRPQALGGECWRGVLATGILGSSRPSRRP